MLFVTDVPETGSYRIGIKAVLGPDQGKVQIFQRDRPVGEAADLYSPNRAVSGLLPLDTQDISAGENLVYLHIVDKNTLSAGLNLDLIEIVLEKLD